MSPEEARLHARELLRRARERGDIDAANVLVDVLASGGYDQLAQDLALALQGKFRDLSGTVREAERGWLNRPSAEIHLSDMLHHIESTLFPPESGREMWQTRTPLPSEIDTPAMERRVRSAAARRFGRGRMEPVFEHGQWWVTSRRTGAQYSVVDTADGFDFEQVSPGDED